ncbi:unnamed protein product [Peronospora effusa]|nr:unnamed protein product [Peronospora effusa]
MRRGLARSGRNKHKFSYAGLCLVYHLSFCTSWCVKFCKHKILRSHWWRLQLLAMREYCIRILVDVPLFHGVRRCCSIKVFGQHGVAVVADPVLLLLPTPLESAVVWLEYEGSSRTWVSTVLLLLTLAISSIFSVTLYLLRGEILKLFLDDAQGITRAAVCKTTTSSYLLASLTSSI